MEALHPGTVAQQPMRSKTLAFTRERQLCEQISYASNLLRITTVDPCFITPGNQFLQILIRHSGMRPFLKQECQILFDIKAMSLCHFHHGVDGSAGMGPAGSIAEQPVAAPNSYRANAVFAGVFGEAAAAIL